MALRDDTVTGGSGYVEATVRDMGFPEDKTEGAKGAEPSVEKRKRTPRKAKEEGGRSWGWRRSRRTLRATRL